MIFNKLFNINKKIDNWSILLVLSTVYLAIDLNIQGFLALLPFIQEEFIISRTQAGLYSTFFFLSATIVGLFGGTIVDYIGAKKGILFGICYTAILVVLHSFAPSFYIILVLALFTGFGVSIITPALNKAMMNSTTPEKRAVSLGITQSGGGIGGFLGATLLPFLGTLIGWRKAITISGIFALLIAFFVYKFYKDKNKNSSINFKSSSFKADIGYLIKQKYLIYISLLGFALGSVAGSVITHFALFMNQDMNLSKTLAGFGLGILQIGGLLGRLFWGRISDRYFLKYREKGLFFVAYIVVFISLLLSLVVKFVGVPLLLLYLITFVMGGVSLGWINIYLIIIAEYVKEEFQGIATGFGLIFYRLGIVIGPPVFGYIADIKGSYQFSWLVFGVFVLLAAIILYPPLKKERHIDEES